MISPINMELPPPIFEEIDVAPPIFEEVDAAPVWSFRAGFDIGYRNFPGAVIAHTPFPPGTRPRDGPLREATGRVRLMSARFWDPAKARMLMSFDRDTPEDDPRWALDTAHPFEALDPKKNPGVVQRAVDQIGRHLVEWDGLTRYGRIPVHIEQQRQAEVAPENRGIMYGIRMCIHAMDVLNGHGAPHREVDYRAKKAGLKRLTKKQKRELVTKMEREAAFVPEDYIERKDYACTLLKIRLLADGDVAAVAFLQAAELAMAENPTLHLYTDDVSDAALIAIERADRQHQRLRMPRIRKLKERKRRDDT